MSAVLEPDVVTEVPQELKRLLRYIIRGFYGMQHALVIEMLIHHPCVKEDDVLGLLQFERKQLRSLLSTLKMDKFLKVRMRVETDADGRTMRHNYYFINYSVFVNVVKYKLDLMRRRIETEERDSTSRASFKCPQCEKAFTDLQVNELLDIMTGQLCCTFCQTEVEEELSAQSRTDARTLMANFNEQLEPIFSLLKEVEDVKLAPELLEPEPMDLAHIKHQATSGSKSRGEKWAQKDSAIDLSGTITIDMNEQQNVQQEKKEQPRWMTQSTVQGAEADNVSQLSGQAGISDSSDLAAAASSQEHDDIMRTLLAHEKTSATPRLPVAGPGGAPSDDESSTSESEDEASRAGMALPSINPIDSFGGFEAGLFAGGVVAPVVTEEMESEEEVSTVSVDGQRVPYEEVTDEMVQRMTPPEKEAYIQMGQEMYQDMYD